MRTTRNRLGIAAVGGAAALTLLAACASPTPTPEGPVDLGDGEPGAAEDTSITVAIPFPDITMYSMFVLASDLGYYEDEGLTVEVITADNVTAAVASGSADIGVESTGTVIDAIRGGVEIDLVSGHYCRQNFDFAVQSDVKSVDDLDGTSIVLAGTPGDPAEFQRAQVLKEEGWDVASVDTEVVYPGPDRSRGRSSSSTTRSACSRSTPTTGQHSKLTARTSWSSRCATGRTTCRSPARSGRRRIRIPSSGSCGPR
ncbi:ABC transporter substrate-binding protein [Microbacterium sp. SY138]|uniref:ABC transporter substrate-binding protein n=1 Tax=Microbacterium sp. SY138 TaxID=3149040 RepID=UPI00321BF834